MISRIVISILVGIITAFAFYVAGTLLNPIVPVIAGILLNVSYAAGVIAGLWYFFTRSGTSTPIL